jgi:hypothetical protein
MKHIHDCINTIQIINGGNTTDDIVVKLQEINNQFKVTFQTAITTLHPEKQTIVNVDKKQKCKQWLSNITNEFEKRIFTLNFDLLLYWTLLQEINNEDVKAKVRDNFQDKEGDKCYFNDSNGSKSLIFLHGALHLFHDKSGTFKTIYNAEHCLIEGIIANIKSNHYPLCIINGTSEQKLSDINNNYYLRTCLKNLSTIKGNLVTYGWSWSEHDKHIIDAILNNNGIDIIYIGCFGEGEYNVISSKINKEFNTIVQKSRSKQNKSSSKQSSRQIVYFDTSDVNPWE